MYHFVLTFAIGLRWSRTTNLLVEGVHCLLEGRLVKSWRFTLVRVKLKNSMERKGQ